MDICKNCGQPIGNLEPSHLWKNNIVCDKCNSILRKPVVEYASAVTSQHGESMPPDADPRYFSGNTRRLGREVQSLRKESKRRSQDLSQKFGCLIMIFGLILLCLFWPAGLIVFSVGLIWALANTRLW